MSWLKYAVHVCSSVLSSYPLYPFYPFFLLSLLYPFITAYPYNILYTGQHIVSNHMDISQLLQDWRLHEFVNIRMSTKYQSIVLREIKSQSFPILVRKQKSDLLLPASILKHAHYSVLKDNRVRMWPNSHPLSPYKGTLCELSAQQCLLLTLGALPCQRNPDFLWIYQDSLSKA